MNRDIEMQPDELFPVFNKDGNMLNKPLRILQKNLQYSLHYIIIEGL